MKYADQNLLMFFDSKEKKCTTWLNELFIAKQNLILFILWRFSLSKSNALQLEAIGLAAAISIIKLEKLQGFLTSAIPMEKQNKQINNDTVISAISLWILRTPRNSKLK